VMEMEIGDGIRPRTVGGFNKSAYKERIDSTLKPLVGYLAWQSRWRHLMSTLPNISSVPADPVAVVQRIFSVRLVGIKVKVYALVQSVDLFC
jgi:hypothetical protein